MKDFSSFFTGAALGFGLVLLSSPKGNELRRRLFETDRQKNGEVGLHTFSVSELLSENSDSLDEIKKKLE